MVEYSTRYQRKIKGQCTHFLSGLNSGDSLLVSTSPCLHEYTFTKKKSKRLLISTGVGITPHLFFLQKHLTSGTISLSKMKDLVSKGQIDNVHKNSKNIEVHVVWGCRLKEKDYITKELFKYFSSVYEALKIRVTFSRETEEKKYVQHLIEHHAKEYGQFLIQNFNEVQIYVCGSSKFLPKSLDKAFKKCFLAVLGEDQGKKAQELLDLLYQNEAIKYESFA